LAQAPGSQRSGWRAGKKMAIRASAHWNAPIILIAKLPFTGGTQGIASC
jgi:hypothetical protein